MEDIVKGIALRVMKVFRFSGRDWKEQEGFYLVSKYFTCKYDMLQNKWLIISSIQGFAGCSPILKPVSKLEFLMKTNRTIEQSLLEAGFCDIEVPQQAIQV